MLRRLPLLLTLCAIVVMVACSGSGSSSTTSPSTPITCGAGTTNVNGVCQLNTIITINSTLQTGIPTACSVGLPRVCDPVPPTCFSFSPNPASVKANVAVQWQNNTSTAVTIIDSTFKPLVSVSGNSTSGGIIYPSAGNALFGVQACAASVIQNNTAFYGQLSITVN